MARYDQSMLFYTFWGISTTTTTTTTTRWTNQKSCCRTKTSSLAGHSGLSLIPIWGCIGFTDTRDDLSIDRSNSCIECGIAQIFLSQVEEKNMGLRLLTHCTRWLIEWVATRKHLHSSSGFVFAKVVIIACSKMYFLL